MEQKKYPDLSITEKALLTTGEGSWKTKSFNGKLPVVVMSDGPHGLRKQEEEEYADINKSNIATCFPTGSALASTWNDEVIEKVATAIAKEAKAEGVTVVLGPAINIKRSPLCGRNFEYYSEDPYLAGHLATSYVNAMQKEGVGSSLKHFAVNNQEKHRQTSNSMVEERALHEIYLKAFEMCIKKAKPATIMASYNRINGKYACANEYLLKKILREKWGYKGTVISDWGAAVDIVQCLKNGLGLEMPDSCGYHAKEILDAIENGTLTESELDEAVEQVLTLASKYNRTQLVQPCDYLVNHNIACEAEMEAAVLLKTEGSLPVKKNERILLLGNMAINNRFQGGGSSHITTLPCPNTYEALKSLGCNVEYSDRIPDSLSEYDKVMYFCGLTDAIESEGYDRTQLQLPAEQIETIEHLTKMCSKLILVTFGGAPFVIPCLDKVSEVLHMHLGGQAVGEACAKLLVGEASPSGKLAETWPLSLYDLPNSKYYATGSNNVPYVEGIYVGYRYFETYEKNVQFPFGYGLSYTNFEYSNLKIKKDDDEITVSYTVKNSGPVAGAEVSQVYIMPKDYKLIPCEMKRLAAYHKDFLQPGESTDITVKLDEYAFSIFDEAGDEFKTLTGGYQVAVGASVKDLFLFEDIEIVGQTMCEHKSSELPELTLENFYSRYQIKDRPDFDDFSKGKYTKYDSLETICNASGIGRLFIGTLKKVMPLVVNTPKDDPATKMVICAMSEAPMDSLTALSNGAIKPNIIEYFVQHANGHPWKGFVSLFGSSKKLRREA